MFVFANELLLVAVHATGCVRLFDARTRAFMIGQPVARQRAGERPHMRDDLLAGRDGLRETDRRRRESDSPHEHVKLVAVFGSPLV